MSQVNGLMIPAGAVASIAATVTAVDPTDFVTRVLQVSDVEKLALQCEAQGGNASATGIVHFNFMASLDGVVWDTDNFLQIAVTMAGVAVIRGTENVDVHGIHSIKLVSIKNNDASYAATNVHCRYGKSFPRSI